MCVTKPVVVIFAAVLSLASPSRVGALVVTSAADEQRSDAEERARRTYDRGMKALDDHKWDAAISAFDDVVHSGGQTAAGALYWKAYAQNKQGQGAEALITLDELRRAFPGNRWLTDARALEVEIRQASGQSVSPEAVADEDLKLFAINSLLSSNSERAIPMLEQILQGPQSPKLKERALFVLTQSNSSRAREVVARVARGSQSPDLQEKALQYLGVAGGQDNLQLLTEIYGSSPDLDVKRRIMRSFMVSGQRERLLNLAKTEKAPELRGEAVRQLGVMGAQEELWQLYQAESSAEVKRQILQGMFVGGGADRLMDLARTEKDPDLRRRAIRNLGLMGSSRTADALLAIYASDKDPAIRKEVIQGLFVQNNARALIDLARKERDPEMKRAIVGKLSLINSKEATDYMLELLKP